MFSAACLLLVLNICFMLFQRNAHSGFSCEFCWNRQRHERARSKGGRRAWVACWPGQQSYPEASARSHGARQRMLGWSRGQVRGVRAQQPRHSRRAQFSNTPRSRLPRTWTGSESIRGQRSGVRLARERRDFGFRSGSQGIAGYVPDGIPVDRAANRRGRVAINGQRRAFAGHDELCNTWQRAALSNSRLCLRGQHWCQAFRGDRACCRHKRQCRHDDDVQWRW